MSRVHAAGKRGPGVVRAAVTISLGCVLLGGCSAGTERFSSLEFGSGYETASPRLSSSASAAAINAPQARPVQQTASVQPKPQSGFQLASANPADNSGGFLQVSRVDLPPVDQQPSGSKGVKTADGYGPYGPAPLSDGTYAGPRVYSPYDSPNGGYAPPPPSGGYAPPPNGYTPPPGGYPPPAQGGYYGGGPSSYAPPPPAPQGGPYGYQQQSQAQPNGRGYNGAPQNYASYGDQRNGTPAPDGRRRARAYADASRGRMVRVAPGESILSLSQRYGVSIAAIAQANHLRGGPITPGMTLYIPGAEPSRLAQAPVPPRTKVAECTGSHCYTVQRGETIREIARTHGVSEQQLLEANNLFDARALKAGQSITIPGEASPRQAMASSTPPNREPQHAAGHVSTSAEASSEESLQNTDAKPATPVKMTSPRQAEPSCEAALANPIPRMGKTFRKPVEGLIIGQFGPQRDGTVNEGLTISVPKGTPIKAAENGVVAYVGDELPGFGNLILIRHAEEYVTAYAHADEIMVKKCEVVKRGQTIGTAGTTGDASQPELHFEIRKNAKPVDPSPLLGS